MTMSVKERQVRAALRQAGIRRRTLKKAENVLHRQTERALKRAEGVVPMEEAAKLVDLSRSTVYQVYLQPGDQNADGNTGSTRSNSRSKNGSPTKGQRNQNSKSLVQEADARRKTPERNSKPSAKTSRKAARG